MYDRHMAADFARRVTPVLEQLLLHALPAGAAVLDLCCGSGRVTQALLERGFRATGVDSSEAMLRLARQNAPGAELVLADMRSLALPHIYAAVVSTFNALAHAHTVDDLGQALRSAHAVLAPGGVMVFDLSMHEQYELRWCGSLCYAGPDAACIVRPSYDPAQRLARNDITIFPRPVLDVKGVTSAARPGSPEPADRKPGTYSLTILQKCHTESEVRHALTEAGFPKIESFDAERDLGMRDESGRRFFRATRGD